MTLADNVKTGPAMAPELAAAFPSDFLWGVATSSYQIEGATHEDGRGESIWDRYAATPGKIFDGQTGDVATDHYHRMEQDVALMAELGLGAYRFSIAWPRILPEGRGTVNERGLDFYDRLVDALLRHNIVPVATLYHWDLPVTLEDEGGWPNRATANAFADYAEVVARRLGDRIDWWTTLNEPWCSAYLGYYRGEHAPGVRDLSKGITAAHHLLLAHGLAVPRIRAYVKPSAQVGITINFSPVYPADESPETLQELAREDVVANRWFVEPVIKGAYPEGLFEILGAQPPILDGDLATIAAPIDFLGVNYYTRFLVSNPEKMAELPTKPWEDGARVPGADYTEMNWEVFPQGMTDLLVRLHQDFGPIALLVTENGAAYEDAWDGADRVPDAARVEYLHGHIGAVAKAIEQGADVKGYFLWSLLDNFEWAWGYSKRFGIVYVDYPTQKRVVKDSGRWYADLIRDVRSSR
jgi:beta-glucosidase